MFGTKKITVCIVSPTGITATIYSKTGKGLVAEQKIENTSFEELRSEFGIKRVRILLPEGAQKEELLGPMLKTASEAGILVEAYEPPSAAMARMASHIHEPFLLVYPPVKPEFICAIQDGKVLEVQPVDPLGSLEDTKHAFIDYVANSRGITVRAIATNVPDPVMGLAVKTDGVTTEKKTLPLPLVIGSIAFFVVAIGFFSIRSWNSGRGKTPTVSPQVSIAPTPTEVPISRTNLKIEVQNGSGVAGLAAKGKKLLEDAGYTTVTTANADNYDYQGVTVKGKTASVSAFVITDIKGTYTNASASSTLLDSSSPVDAIVILGK